FVFTAVASNPKVHASFWVAINATIQHNVEFHECGAAARPSGCNRQRNHFLHTGGIAGKADSRAGVGHASQLSGGRWSALLTLRAGRTNRTLRPCRTNRALCAGEANRSLRSGRARGARRTLWPLWPLNIPHERRLAFP